jgi:glycosyltransferase involved in cell wall biosynthesis
MPKTEPSKPGHRAATPALSVVMPVHNALPYLDQAVESILGQTFTDFEVLILDDASTDGSTRRLEHWAASDARIRLDKVDRNLGPVHSSNRVARAARAPFVARMDADDISYPERLAEQIKLLREHPEVGLVAGLCDMIDAAGRKMRDPEIWRLSRRSVFVPFAHGSTMYRRDVFDRVGGYREECEYWEDQDLVVRIAAIAKVAIIPRPLYQWRQSTTSTRVHTDQDRLERALDRAYQATDRLRRGEPYDGTFDNSGNGRRKIDPRVFIAIGSVRLWGYGRPRLFRRLLSRARISLNPMTASALIWTAWASASPSSLRAFLMFLLAARSRVASGRVSTAQPLLWHPLEGIRPLEEAGGKS